METTAMTAMIMRGTERSSRMRDQNSDVSMTGMELHSVYTIMDDYGRNTGFLLWEVFPMPLNRFIKPESRSQSSTIPSSMLNALSNFH